MKLLLYCTKAKPYLIRNDLLKQKGKLYKNWQLCGEVDKKHLYSDASILNGKIVAECDYEIEEIERSRYYHSIEDYDYIWDTVKLTYDKLLKKACMNNNQLEDYLEFNGYAIHIKNLHIFDKPRELSEYKVIRNNGYSRLTLTKAPQNMMKIKEFKNGIVTDYILISIKPEWLCKILNKEKTIEVRKKVLKEVLK